MQHATSHSLCLTSAASFWQMSEKKGITFISIRRLISFDARAYPSFSSMRWLQEHVLAGCDTSSTPHSLSIFSGFSDHLPVPVFTPGAWRHIYTTHIKSYNTMTNKNQSHISTEKLSLNVHGKILTCHFFQNVNSKWLFSILKITFSQ